MDTNVIITGDCLAVLPTLPAASIDLAFADPPFNIGLRYPGYHDRRPDAAYLAWLEDCFAAVRRVLVPTGSLWVAIARQHLAKVHLGLERVGFYVRDTIVWHYTFGPAQQRRFTPAWVPIIYAVMDPKRRTFNADAIRVPSDRQIKYRDKRGHPDGKVPDNVWTFRRVCGTHKERVSHVCQMPLAVLERIVRIASNPDGIVLDPMCGPGTTAVAAQQLGRRFIGIELCDSTAEIARGRLADTA